jgi:hypothetical protein
MSDIATPTGAEHGAPHLATMPALALGAIGGFALGVVARGWMRLISDDPRFTWNGTIFIVGGFAFFGLTQTFVAVARRGTSRWWRLTGIRTIGAVGMLPLFVAAGALMMPAVTGCGFASTRPAWPRAVRGLCLAIAAVPVLFVGTDLIDSFGWSLHAFAGFVLMLAVYAPIIWASRFTFAVQDAHSPAPARARTTISVVVALLILIAFIAGGGIK